jgi:CubicO group peptidase (beta-lactamase class C family)
MTSFINLTLGVALAASMLLLSFKMGHARFMNVRRSELIVVLFAVISRGSDAQQPIPSPQARQEQNRQAITPIGAMTTARFDQIFGDLMNREHVPGLAVAVARNGIVDWDKAYGRADLETGASATSRTLFRIGSITKAITAVAILQLADRGKIDLDASVDQYVPAFPRKRFPVTLAGLLSGTSGIRGYAGDEYRSNHHYASLAASLEMFRDDSLAYEPGTSYLETPFGFTLLGLSLQAVTGVSYEEYLSRSVFAPAHMIDTKVDVPAQMVRRRAHMYTRDSSGTVHQADAIDPSYKVPAGGLLSTARDVAHFGAALIGGALLSPRSYGRMSRPVHLQNGSDLPLGMGVALGNAGGRLLGSADAIWATGLQQGGTAVLLMYPHDRIVVAVLMNMNGESGADGFGLLKRAAVAAESAAVQLRQIQGDKKQ